MPYQDYVRERLFEPVGLTRVSFEPEPPAANGYLAQPYADGVWDTIGVETGAWASAGQLWGTAGDICRWGAFLADPDESVLASSSAEEMRTVQADRRPRALAVGLWARPRAAPLYSTTGAVFAGAASSQDRIWRARRLDARLHRAPLFSAKEKVVAPALTNESEAALGDLGLALAQTTIEEWPVAPETWRIGEPPPDDVVPLLGIWFMEAARLVFRWREGKLEARFDGSPDWQPPLVYERETDDRWRTVSGPGARRGAALERGPDGSVARMVWAGYPVTREPGPWRAPE